VAALNPHSAPPTGTHAVGGAECGLQHSGWPATWQRGAGFRSRWKSNTQAFCCGWVRFYLGVSIPNINERLRMSRFRADCG